MRWPLTANSHFRGSQVLIKDQKVCLFNHALHIVLCTFSDIHNIHKCRVAATNALMFRVLFVCTQLEFFFAFRFFFAHHMPRT